jgi:hypothetical protein
MSGHSLLVRAVLQGGGAPVDDRACPSCLPCCRQSQQLAEAPATVEIYQIVHAYDQSVSTIV